MEARDNMFYFFYKIIIFIVNREKDDIRNAYCKSSQLGKSQTTLSNYENTLVDQSKHTYYTNYFTNYCRLCSTFYHISDDAVERRKLNF